MTQATEKTNYGNAFFQGKHKMEVAAELESAKHKSPRLEKCALDKIIKFIKTGGKFPPVLCMIAYNKSILLCYTNLNQNVYNDLFYKSIYLLK